MVKLLMGDVVEMLGRLPDESVQMAVTSPPYWGLRTYGVDGQIGHESVADCGCHGKLKIRGDINVGEATLALRGVVSGVWRKVWAGECERLVQVLLPTEVRRRETGAQKSVASRAQRAREAAQEQGSRKEEMETKTVDSDLDVGREVHVLWRNGRDVSLSGSYKNKWSSAIQDNGWSAGVEKGNRGRTSEEQIPASLLELQLSVGDIRFLSTFVVDKSSVPASHIESFTSARCGRCYVCRLVDVARGVKRVIRDDGVFWLNIGDSFSTSDGSFGRSDPKSQKSNAYNTDRYYKTGKFEGRSGLPPKNLLLIPSRVALALQADGWIVRQDVVWHKVSCLPEPTKDRPSSTHEHLFLLAKTPRYYYDKKATGELSSFRLLGNGTKYQNSVWALSSGSSGINVCKNCSRLFYPDEYKRLASSGRSEMHDASRKKASKNLDDQVRDAKVCSRCGGTEWEAHAAPYPQKLVAPCIMAGTSDKGACVNCGTCWIRDGKSWKKNCECKTNEVRPCIVLDPFNGSGTTGVVALRLGRSYLGVDLSPAYTGAAYERLARVAKVRGINW